MGNILFYYDNYCGANSKGGTEVATFRIALALNDKGWKVFNAHRKGNSDDMDSLYLKTIRLSHSNRKFREQLRIFIRDNRIDVVVNMSRFFRHRLIADAVAGSGRDVKIVFMQHFAPGSEIKKGTYSAGWHLLKLNPVNPLYWLRASVYPLFKLHRRLAYPRAYREVYELSSRVVLLSDGYKEKYKEFAGLEDDDKFVTIGNIFDGVTGAESDQEDKGVAKGNKNFAINKEKRVLILSRMDEIQKRISLALKIWKIIQEKPAFHDWQLDIVGSGHDFKALKKLASKLKLHNVTFHGWQKPEEFLKRSAILMMTSEYEGLPLSVLEALNYGCVPIAFNSFASVGDVIKDKETGVLVYDCGDIYEYASKLECLMQEENVREKLAAGAGSIIGNFSSEAISRRWLRMLNNMKS